MPVFKKTLAGGGEHIIRSDGVAPNGFSQITEDELISMRLLKRVESRRLKAVASSDATATSRYAAAKLALTT